MTDALKTLLERYPLEHAMPRLVPRRPQEGSLTELAKDAATGASLEVQAGIWLYVDDLEQSHAISQAIESPTGSYWHGIMHRREGDFSNAKYWFRRVGSHPVIDELGYDPFAFVDDCANRHQENPADLLELQRREWKALFDWCLKEGREPR